MPKSLLLFLLMWCCTAIVATAQELNCEVRVSTENVTIADRQLVSQMEKDISQFLNKRRWTNETYRPEERINCKLFIGIQAIPQSGTYQATARIISSRPVYGTGYETNLLTFADKGWVFNYSPQNPLDYSETSFVSNLSSLLSFYAYIVIGMDHDSFARMGGSPYYDVARQIVANAASQTLENDKGWKDTESRNRYWLLNNLQDPQLEACRTALYAYYRQGLDIFIEKPKDARASMVSALQGIQQAAQRRPGTLLIRAFFDAKADEIANVFRTSQEQEQKATVVTMLTEIDPTNSAKYQSILQR
ncbi:hypothetical protein PK28_05950 [Hymenobacter sp. DG25B]|uniref:type IX secretion system protein PorD n=1 Tax=Hymenobacter sp. DG25B TaxID=1385664 RepID=UPI0005408369|nr:DUF4835 family protein [Hymenobacter sp. DG25B]AIZ63354.1 hypothetical protein PK28_05950 [Hymenobacter sp. DG25B]